MSIIQRQTFSMLGDKRKKLSNIALLTFIPIDMAAGQRKPDGRKSRWQTLNHEMICYSLSILLLLTSDQETALKVSKSFNIKL